MSYEPVGLQRTGVKGSIPSQSTEPCAFNEIQEQVSYILSEHKPNLDVSFSYTKAED